MGRKLLLNPSSVTSPCSKKSTPRKPIPPSPSAPRNTSTVCEKLPLAA